MNQLYDWVFFWGFIWGLIWFVIGYIVLWFMIRFVMNSESLVRSMNPVKTFYLWHTNAFLLHICVGLFIGTYFYFDWLYNKMDPLDHPLSGWPIPAFFLLGIVIDLLFIFLIFLPKTRQSSYIKPTSYKNIKTVKVTQSS